MSQILHWVELPKQNVERATSFYSSVLKINLSVMEAVGMKTTFFSHSSTTQTGGCLMQSTAYVPSDKGSIIYFNGGSDLHNTLNRVEKARGKILLPKTSLGQNEFMAHILDSEGNRVGLHAKK